MAKVLKYVVATLAVITVGLIGVLRLAPPDLLRVGTNYSAKIVCSNVFIAGRDADEVLTVDVQAPGHPLLGYVSANVDTATRTVTTQLFGFAAPATSQYRDGLGCTNIHEAALSTASLDQPQRVVSGLWPLGEDVALSQDPDVLAALSDEGLLGEGHRAVVVVKDGRIIAENYAEGFDQDTPLLGWSMTKTVTAAIIGTLEQSGAISRQDSLTGTYPSWSQDDRAAITIADMLGMASSLEWNEGYGNVSDVTRMLYLSDDMASFAASKPTVGPVGTVFNYSSGTSTALSRAWQDKVGDASISYPKEALFDPLGMASAVMETDATDTFVGSSYMYATGRDWARFGQFLLQRGNWNGRQLLPEGYVDWMFEEVEVSQGAYGRGHLWVTAPGGDPTIEDGVWLLGHDGQSIGIFPSRNMVIVRLGLTPSALGYSSRPLAQSLINALGD